MKDNKSLILISAVFGTIILIIGILNHYYFRTYALDYASYNFAWFDYAHLQISKCPTYFWTNERSFFQDHFSFTLIFLAPFYWILTPVFGTYSLLIVQAFFIIWGGFGTYWLVKLKTKNQLFSSLALLLYYVTYGRWASFITDVNLEIILASLIPLFLYYFEKGNFKIASLFFVFLILGRENISLWFMFIGLFLAIEHWKQKKQRQIALIYVLVSLLFFVLTFKVILPIVHKGIGFNLFNYSALGANPVEAVKTMLAQPLHSLKLLFINHSGDDKYNFVKAEFYYVYLLSGLFLIVFRPKYLLLFIPIIAQKMYNDYPIRWSIELYYSIEIVCLLPFTVYIILSEIKVKTLSETKLNFIKKTIAWSIIVSALLVTIHKFDISNRKIKWFAIDKNQFYNKAFYTSNLDIPKINNYLKVIPDTAKVAACSTIAPHLAFRQYIYSIPRIDDASYIVLFKNQKHYTMTMQQHNEFIDTYINNANWEILVNDDPLIIFHKK